MAAITIERTADGWRMRCPGCNITHAITNLWQCDGNFEAPTISPSILVQWGRGQRCHSFVRAGQWEFLSDCTHHLAGQTVPMVPLYPDDPDKE